MLRLFRRASARPGRTRSCVVLRLDGFELEARATPTGPPYGQYGPPATNQAPVITVQCSEIGSGLILITGTVTDDQDVAGLVVRFGGIPSAATKQAIVQLDGTFAVTLRVKTDGTDIGDLTAQTTDIFGLDSNVAWYSLHPTPPGGN